MQIGKPSQLRTSISTATPDSITVRNRDLCKELIGQVSLTEFFCLLLTGQPPTDTQRLLLDASLVSISEHGLVPSIQAARMTYAAAPEALQGAVAAGLLGCGSVVLGSSEEAGKLFAALLAKTPQEGTLAEVVEREISALRARRAPLPGFGHPLHQQEDPRATRLLALADELGTTGENVRVLRAIAAAVPQIYGRALPINVSGAIPAVLLDVGFPLKALKGVPLVARSVSLVAHLLEESMEPIGFALAHAGESAISYVA
ncbi:MAG: citrate synthase [Paraburkholderia sp.]|nr:citrate synthase [Paraburkholderia sp.]